MTLCNGDIGISCHHQSAVHAIAAELQVEGALGNDCFTFKDILQQNHGAAFIFLGRIHSLGKILVINLFTAGKGHDDSEAGATQSGPNFALA